MRVIVSYDIAQDRTRGKMARILEGYSERVQRSVFEGEMAEGQLARLRKRLSRVELGAEDSIRYYILCQACGERVVIQGVGEIVRAPRHFVV